MILNQSWIAKVYEEKVSAMQQRKRSNELRLIAESKRRSRLPPNPRVQPTGWIGAFLAAISDNNPLPIHQSSPFQPAADAQSVRRQSISAYNLILLGSWPCSQETRQHVAENSS